MQMHNMKGLINKKSLFLFIELGQFYTEVNILTSLLKQDNLLRVSLSSE